MMQVLSVTTHLGYFTICYFNQRSGASVSIWKWHTQPQQLGTSSSWSTALFLTCVGHSSTNSIFEFILQVFSSVEVIKASPACWHLECEPCSYSDSTRPGYPQSTPHRAPQGTRSEVFCQSRNHMRPYFCRQAHITCAVDSIIRKRRSCSLSV